MPMGVTSKRPKGSKVFSSKAGFWALSIYHFSTRSLSRIRGLDPTRVRQPPIMAQNPMGINIRDTGMFNLRLIRKVAGIKRAAAPIFCIKLEIKATVPETRAVIRRSL